MANESMREQMHEVMHHPNLGQTVARTPEEKAAAEKRGFRSGDIHQTVIHFGHGDKLKPHQEKEPEPEAIVEVADPVEYPKALHKADHHERPTHIVVHNAAAEAAAKAEGWGPMPPLPEPDVQNAVIVVPPAPPVAAVTPPALPAPPMPPVAPKE